MIVCIINSLSRTINCQTPTVGLTVGKIVCAGSGREVGHLMNDSVLEREENMKPVMLETMGKTNNWDMRECYHTIFELAPSIGADQKRLHKKISYGRLG